MKPPYPLSDKHPLIRDRGRGPELVNSRITVFDLLPNLMDPRQTDADILAWYPTLDAHQLAAVRAYALEYAERLLPEQREWEARPHPRNSPEVEARMREARPRIRARMRVHQAWLSAREQAPDGTFRPTLDEWFLAHGLLPRGRDADRAPARPAPIKNREEQGAAPAKSAGFARV